MKTKLFLSVFFLFAVSLYISGCKQDLDLGINPNTNNPTDSTVHSVIKIGNSVASNGDTIRVRQGAVVSFYDMSTGPVIRVWFRFYDNGDTITTRAIDHLYNYPVGSKFRVSKYTVGPTNTDSSWVFIKVDNGTTVNTGRGEHFVLYANSIYNPNNGKYRYFEAYNKEWAIGGTDYPFYIRNGLNYIATDMWADSIITINNHVYWKASYTELWDSTTEVVYGGFGGHNINPSGYQYAWLDSSIYYDPIKLKLVSDHIGGQIYRHGVGPIITMPGTAGDLPPQNRKIARWEVTANNTIKGYYYMPSVPNTTGYNPWVQIYRNNAWYTPNSSEIISKGYVGSSGWYMVEYSNSFLASLAGNLKTKFGTDVTLQSTYDGSKFMVNSPELGKYLDQYFIGFRPGERLELK